MTTAPGDSSPISSLRESSPPGSLPSLDEEVWVIARYDLQQPVDRDEEDELPGGPVLVTTLPRHDRPVPLPLRETDVNGRVDGAIASVEVTQSYVNPYDGKIEAVYVFPLPENAAVSGFVMTIGERKIRAVVRKREEAERLYHEARGQGYRAALLTQERPNVFTQKVANIEPAAEIDIRITYFHTLRYDDGWYELVFPAVVGPRFNPPGSTGGVAALPRGGAGRSGQGTEAEYLRPGERSDHSLSIKMALRAGGAIKRIESVNHEINYTDDGEGGVVVSLTEGSVVPDRDFVLRWKVAGEGIGSGFVTHFEPGVEEGYFTLMLYPPDDLSRLERSPVELVFVIDCSGSMEGRPLEQAKRAMDRALSRLAPSDTFAIIRFSDSASAMGPRPLEATRRNIEKARRYVDDLRADGGTMMMSGLRAAMACEKDDERLRFVVFMTDGYIGNEAEVLGEMRAMMGRNRVFSFGVGSSPNRYLMDRMAEMGRGAVAYLPLGEEAEPVMDAFLERIAHPAMTEVRVDFGGLDVSEVLPAESPDLFVGRPVMVTGKLRRAEGERATVRVRGKAAGRRVEVAMEVGTGVETGWGGSPAVAAVWARRKIADLMNRQMIAAAVGESIAGDDAPGSVLERRITETALRYGLVSAYTALIAVDSTYRTAGSEGTTVHQAVPVPDGVRYETTVE